MKNLSSLLGVAFVLASCSSNEKTDDREKYRVVSPLVIDTVYNDEFVASIHALQNVEIRARVKGFIETIFVDEGKSVKKGQTLFLISSKDYEQRLLKARAITKSAAAELKAAEIELENSKKLLEKDIIAKPEYDFAAAKVEALHAKVDEVKSDEERANISLSFTEVKAPFDGIINRIPNKTGSLIEEGDLLTTISNSSNVYAYFHVSEKEYLDYATSSPTEKKSLEREVSLILANGDEYAHQGIIETSESEFDQTTGNIAFRAKFPNPEGLLKHGSNGKVVLDRILKKAILIPQKSTFEIQDKLYVYVVKPDSTLEQRNIVSNIRLPHIFIVESGLKANETILFEGVQSAKEGDKIIPARILFNQIND
ncbi:MAG: efflux RND transporter periplasmic adaptor subunit [Bacteroidetes bacterium]|nr:efflux RND transporter periplasmic adaptor subunit [Bacteroidota bacterium]